MKRLIGFLFLFLSISIYAKENIIRIQEVIGQVEINGGGKSISPAVNSYLPSNSEIKIKANGKLEISINEEIFIIKGPIELNLAKIHSMRNMTKTITFTASVRGLQNDILNQIEEKSEEAYGECVRSHNGSLKDHNEWKPILEKVFTRLMDVSSREAFKLKYSILQDKEFNAAAFPGGQFVIHTATLDRIDLESKKNAGNDDKAYKLNREKYAAGVIAHELAHYYNNHTLQKVKKIISFNEEKKESYEVVLLEEVKFNQDLELDADSSGLILLQKAGYEASAMIDMLELLNKVHQETAKLQKTQIPFFASHPTPHDRLKVFEGSKKDLHTWAAEMEKVFANIQLGKDLEKSRKFLEESLKKKGFEDNLELTKALAVCLHKIWLETVQLKDQNLRSILDMPSFRDDMVFKKEESTKGDKEIPGDIAKYFDAKDKYEEVVYISGDLAFISNYATILSYFVNNKDVTDTRIQKEKAVFLAEVATALKTIQVYNNLALVYFNSSEEKKALGLIRQLASQLQKEENAKRFLAILSPNVRAQYLAEVKQDKLGLYYNDKYVRDEFTPILNLSILEYLEGNKENAKEYAKVYFSMYDNESKWAKYLSTLTGEKIQEANQDNPAKQDIKLENGMKEKDLESLLGKDFQVRGGYRVYTANGKKIYIKVSGGVVKKVEK